MAYKLTLTEDDIAAASFVGYRYCWSDMLLRRASIGENDLAEHEAWDLAEAFEADTLGAHPPFPMLDPQSDLAAKLQKFWDAIV